MLVGSRSWLVRIAGRCQLELHLLYKYDTIDNRHPMLTDMCGLEKHTFLGEQIDGTSLSCSMFLFSRCICEHQTMALALCTGANAMQHKKTERCATVLGRENMPL